MIDDLGVPQEPLVLDGGAERDSPRGDGLLAVRRTKLEPFEQHHIVGLDIDPSL